jgi:hypothetical protein
MNTHDFIFLELLTIYKLIPIDLRFPVGDESYVHPNNNFKSQSCDEWNSWMGTERDFWYLVVL